MEKFIKKNIVDSSELLSGLSDAEGDVNKINKHINLTTKDAYVLNLIKSCAKRNGMKFNVRLDRKQRYYVEIKEIKKFQTKIGFRCHRKSSALKEMIEGNLTRDKDLEYLKKFSKDLEKGTTVKVLSDKFKISPVTVRIVLRNLYTGKYVKRKKIGLTKGYSYFYELT